MRESHGFLVLGYGVQCDHCGRVHEFTGASDIEVAKRLARIKGMIVNDDYHFCNELCKQEHQPGRGRSV